MTQKVRVIIFTIIFIGAGLVLLLLSFEDQKSQQDFNVLQDIANQQDKPAETAETGELNTDLESTQNETPTQSNKGLSDLSYNQLYELNNDFKAWIKIRNTNVNYPVMQSDEPNYYLNKDFYKKNSSYGVPYLDERYTKTSQNALIYGHSMTNTTMFADLLKYTSQDYFNTNNIIEYTDQNGYSEYKIFAAYDISINDEFDYNNYINMDETRYNEYIQNTLNNSLFDGGIVPKYQDKLITLSTCENSSDDIRFVVVAVEI